METAAKWAMLSRTFVCRAILRLSKRRLIEGGIALLGGLLLACSVAQAAMIEADDILGVSNKLIRVDGKTGVRSVISDFSNPAQGPVISATTGVAIGRGKIFVTDPNGVIFMVDAHTGHRRPVGNFNQGAIQGTLYPGLAVDGLGRIVASLQTQGFPFYHSFVARVVPRTDKRAIVSEFFGLYVTDLIVAPSNGDPEHPSGTILIGTLDHPGFYDIFRVDQVTGSLSLVADFADPARGVVLGDFVCPGGLAAEHSGRILTAAAVCDNTINVLLSVDPKSGHHTVVSDFNNPAQGPGGPTFIGAAIAVQSSGRVIVAANGNLYRVNPLTGKRALFSDVSDPRQGPPVGVSYMAVVPPNEGFCTPPPAGSFTSPFGATK